MIQKEKSIKAITTLPLVGTKQQFSVTKSLLMLFYLVSSQI